MLRVEGLQKTFDDRPVLRGVSFTLETGQAALLVGPNGAGKTTLLRILATLSKPTGGRFLVGAHDPERAEEPWRVRLRTGYVAHEPLVYDDLTGSENLQLVARAAGMGGPKAAERCGALLETFALTPVASRRTGTYSRGMRQRLAVARALVAQPDVLLLDEPASNMDEASQRTLREVLSGLKGAVTTLIATHEAASWGAWADRVLRLENGLMREGPGAA